MRKNAARAPMRAAALLVAIVAASGCLSPITERLRAGDVEEPRWTIGDWWTYAVTSETTEVAGEITVVVADILPDGAYVVGIPTQAQEGEDPLAALLFHMPPIGPVARDLSWDVHGTRFEPAQWPLAEGKTWETTWISANVRLTARQNGTHWTINNSGYEQDTNTRYELVYDPAAKWFTSYTRASLDGTIRQSMELVANGTGYNGTLRAPRFIEVAFLDSRTNTIITPGGLPAAPNPRFRAPDTADTLLVGCLAGGAPGQYHSEVRIGDGVVCSLDENIQPGDSTTRAQLVEIDAPEGELEARLVAVGQGSATVEVLAWPTLNYTLGG